MADSSRAAAWTRRLVAIVALALCCCVFFDHIALLGLGLWVARFPHSRIDIVVFDSAGRALDAVDFMRAWRPALIVRDRAGSPRFGLQYGLGAVRVAVPQGESVSLEMLWPVPGFGRVLVTADNRGRGYDLAPGVPLRIELLPEFARSHLARVQRWVELHNQGRYASPRAAADIDGAARLIAEMERSSGAARRAELSLDALRTALIAGEQEVLAEARSNIAKCRRGTLLVRVLDSRGKPLPGTAVTVKEIRPEFLFGVYSDGYDVDTIARLKALGLNYAEVSPTWKRTEPRPGQYSFDEFDYLFNPRALRENDFTLYGHALTWLADTALPGYMQALRGRTGAVVARTREHVAQVVAHYRDQVQIWEAIDEGHTAWSRLGLDDRGVVEVAKASAQEIRRQAPNARISVEVTLPLGEDVALKYYPFIYALSLGSISAASGDPYQYVKRLNRAGVDYDILALQFYDGARVHAPGGVVQVPAIDLLRFACELDRWGRLGKPLQIAETAAGSSHGASGWESWWHAPADQQSQADYLEGVFTLAYADPRVEGINWWGLDDRYRAVVDGGLFDRALRPVKLLEGWRSAGRVVTSAGGSASFDGAPGDYRVAASVGGAILTGTARIPRGGSATLTIRAPSFGARELGGPTDLVGGSTTRPALK